MKRTIAAVAVLSLFVVGSVRGQEKLPAEHAKKAAEMLVEKAKDLAEPQVKVDPDAEKATGIKEGEYAVLVIPEKGFTHEKFEKAAKDAVVPVGQLWMRSVAPVVNGEAVAVDKLRTFTLSADGQDHKLALLLIGARHKADGSWEVLVFGKEKEPLAVLPISADEKAQELPIDLEGKHNDNGTGDLILRTFGKFKATLVVGPKEL